MKIDEGVQSEIEKRKQKWNRLIDKSKLKRKRDGGRITERWKGGREIQTMKNTERGLQNVYERERYRERY